MPITPFHFGAGALLQAMAPRQVSFLSFCAANVLIDCESLYNLVHQREPVHAFFHSYVGATLVIWAVMLLWLVCRWLAVRLKLPELFGWRDLGGRQVLLGAVLGAYSHIVLDSIMHADIQPWWPFSTANGLLHVISLSSLHMGCLVMAALGLMIGFARWLFSGGRVSR